MLYTNHSFNWYSLGVRYMTYYFLHVGNLSELKTKKNITDLVGHVLLVRSRLYHKHSKWASAYVRGCVVFWGRWLSINVWEQCSWLFCWCGQCGSVDKVTTEKRFEGHELSKRISRGSSFQTGKISSASAPAQKWVCVFKKSEEAQVARAERNWDEVRCLDHVGLNDTRKISTFL